nr:MAG TPA: hypothetical protein [Caudoviricetes sp.]
MRIAFQDPREGLKSLYRSFASRRLCRSIQRRTKKILSQLFTKE